MYKRKDFISLKKLADQLSQEQGDSPDLKLALQFCLDKGIRTAIELFHNKQVWYFSKPVPTERKSHFSPTVYPYKGEKIATHEKYRMLFLLDESLKTLCDSNLDCTSFTKFSSDGSQWSNGQCNLLIVASTQQVEMYRFLNVDLNEKPLLCTGENENDREVVERENIIRKQKFKLINQLPNDDGFIQVDISQICVLRADLPEHNLPTNRTNRTNQRISEGRNCKSNRFLSACLDAYRKGNDQAEPENLEQLLNYCIETQAVQGYRNIQIEKSNKSKKIKWDVNSISYKILEKKFKELISPSH